MVAMRPWIRSVVPCEPGGCGAPVGEKCHAYRDTSRHGRASGHLTEDVHAARWRRFHDWLDDPARKPAERGKAALMDVAVNGAVTEGAQRSGMRVYDHHDSPWAEAAEHYLQHALSDVVSGYDALPAVSAAEACLRIEAHELPPDAGLLIGLVDPVTGEGDGCGFC